LKPNEMKEIEDAKDNINKDLDKWELERMN
jgi:hypothetical protein